MVVEDDMFGSTISSPTGPDVVDNNVKGIEVEISCDVATVGFGPVGQALSAPLAKTGLKVVKVKKYADRYHLSRAGHFDGEIMRIWQALGREADVELVSTSHFANVSCGCRPGDLANDISRRQQCWLPGRLSLSIRTHRRHCQCKS